jgi:hypothetical protein
MLPTGVNKRCLGKNQDEGVRMERIANGRHTKEFREEAVKMSTDGSLSVLEISATGGFWILVAGCLFAKVL